MTRYYLNVVNLWFFFKEDYNSILNNLNCIVKVIQVTNKPV